jgi:hypothetical protein
LNKEDERALQCFIWQFNETDEIKHQEKMMVADLSVCKIEG